MAKIFINNTFSVRVLSAMVDESEPIESGKPLFGFSKQLHHLVLTFTSGLPGGNRNNNGTYNNMGNNGYWWSSTENNTNNAWNRNLNYDNSNVNRNNNTKKNGFSCRCARD